MDFFRDFTALVFAVSVVILLCNIVLFFVLIICIPTISGRVKRNTESIDENSRRLEEQLKKMNKNLNRLNRNMENDSRREFIQTKEETLDNNVVNT
ncbi:hypothetical protein QJR26_02315 [Clostridium baratii]